MPNYAVQSPNNPMRSIDPAGFPLYSFGALTGVAISASPTGLVRAANGGTVALTTSSNHNFAVGEQCTITNATSVLGQPFNGNYQIQAVGSGTTATLQPLDWPLQHALADTGGAGTATSIAFETPSAPQAGQAFALLRPGWGSGIGFYVNGKFSGAPGAFEVDVQVADVDADARYQTIANGNVTTVDATNNTFHLDASNTSAKFVRLRILSRTNLVGFIGTIGS